MRWKRIFSPRNLNTTRSREMDTRRKDIRITEGRELMICLNILKEATNTQFHQSKIINRFESKTTIPHCTV